MRRIPLDAFLFELSVHAAGAQGVELQTWHRGEGTRERGTAEEIYARPSCYQVEHHEGSGDIIAESVHLAGHAAHIVATQPKAIIALVERVRALMEFAARWGENLDDLAKGARAARLTASADAFDESTAYIAKLLAPIEVP